MTRTRALSAVIGFNVVYLVLGALYFLQDLNFEFVIYVAVIVAILGLVFGTLRITKFPVWLLWLLSIWGLLHVLGGAVTTSQGGVLFAYRIYPFLDAGGDFYILKYDQLVHGYLYGVVTAIFYYLLRGALSVRGPLWLVLLVAVMASMGVSAMNEIMEFLISVALPRNGVGGYENAMLDLIFNFSGAVLAAIGLSFVGKKR
jgi:uncharacterized membrane protein YjdF